MGKFLDIFKRNKTADGVIPLSPIANDRTGDVISSALNAISASLRVGGTIKREPVDGLEAFENYGEVFFPIHFIASRIAGAHFEIKRTSNDAIVWCTSRSAAASSLERLLTQPNSQQTWSQFVYSHFVNKLATGNAFVLAAMSDTLPPDMPKWRWADQLWTLPTSKVDIQTCYDKTRLFGMFKANEIVLGYEIKEQKLRVAAHRVWHDRDLQANFGQTAVAAPLKSASRLTSVRRNIGNLAMVYDARHAIYESCGALGMITNRTKDDTGPVALTEKEKKEIRDQYQRTQGITKGRSPILITDKDLAYTQMATSIAHLMPFEETLADAVAIAGAYEIPSVLIPRKDQSTFDNQANAEKAVYSNVIQRLAKQFCKELTDFLGVEGSGYYIDVNFDDVACMQAGRKEAEDVLSAVQANCRQLFADGMITYNDWRGRVHEAALEGETYNKVLAEMTNAEIEFFNSRLQNIFGTPNNIEYGDGN